MPIFVHQSLKLLLEAVKRKTGKGGRMNFSIGRGTENFTLGHGGDLKFSQKVLKSLPGPPRQLFMTTPIKV